MKFGLFFASIAAVIMASSSPLHAAFLKRGDYATKSEVQQLPTPSSDTAVIVFALPLEAHDLIGGISGAHAQIYDVTAETPILAGNIRRGTKFAYEVPEGQHIFMSNGLLFANVQGGKTYYVYVDEPPFTGVFAKLHPVRNGGSGKLQYDDQLRPRIESLTLVEVTPKALKHFSGKRWVNNAKKGRSKNLKKWDSMPEDERQKRTLNPEDGF